MHIPYWDIMGYDTWPHLHGSFGPEAISLAPETLMPEPFGKPFSDLFGDLLKSATEVLHLHIVCLNYDGNAFDLCLLAAVAALEDLWRSLLGACLLSKRLSSRCRLFWAKSFSPLKIGEAPTTVKLKGHKFINQGSL